MPNTDESAPRHRTSVSDVIGALSGKRLVCLTEKELHSLVSDALTSAGIEHVNEHRLGKKSRIDIWIPESKIGMELKVSGDTQKIVKQLKRYAEYEDIEKLILVTPSRAIAYAMPGHVRGATLFIARTSR